MSEDDVLLEAFDAWSADASRVRRRRSVLGGAVRVGAVILAAGSSSRLGTPKQLLNFRGNSLLRNAVLAALGAACSPVVVVTGAYAELVRGEVEGLAVRVVWNAGWESGLASSIRAGVAELLEADPSVGAVVLLLCDQPHVTADVVSGLVSMHRATGKHVIASSYGGSVGVPALFSREMFEELAVLQGGQGAKYVIAKHASVAEFLPFPAGELDVDTPEDLARLRAGDPLAVFERQ